MDFLSEKIDLGKFDVISFDIFDTVLFRNCSTPKDIFRLTAEVAREKLGEKFTFSNELFYELRILAERKAREKNKSNKEEISIEDIYLELPFNKDVRDLVLAIELQEECKNISLNNQIYDYIKYCFEKNKIIILISDMYLSKKQIITLLETVDFNLSYVKDIYVSSQYNATKKKGTLYKRVVDDLGDLNVLHIGDNFQDDVTNAKKMGLSSIHYGAIPEDFLSIYNIEEFLSAETANEIRSLRKLVGYTKKYDGIQLDRYQLGAQIFGPVYVLYSEWVVEFAKKHNIKQIFPLMREGKLFSQLINEINIYDELNLTIEPLYVSRKATFLPSFKNVEPKDIKKLMEKNGLHVENLLSLFGLDVVNTPFKYIRKKCMKDLIVNDFALFSDLYNFLTNEEVLKEINNNAKKQRLYLSQYINQLTGNESFITVDFGFNGTIQKNLDKILDDLNVTPKHLLFIPSNKVSEGILEGHSITTWVDLKNKKLRKNIQKSTEILEGVINVSHGTTLSYKQNPINHKIIPVLDEYEYPTKHKEAQEICWEGIIDFQKVWLKSDSRKKNLKHLLQKPSALAVIFERLIRYPLSTEAKILGDLIQHECFNFTKTSPMISLEDYKWLENLGIETFLNKTAQAFEPYEVYWPQGVVENAYPGFYKKQFLEQCLDNELLINIYNKLLKIDKSRYNKVSIYGAGELGLKVLKIAEILEIDISYFIDRNYSEMEYGYEGKVVKGMEEVKNETDLIIIASLAYLEEILNYLETVYSGEKRPSLLHFN